MHSLWFKHLSAILDPLAMDEAMLEATLKYFENKNHILHNGLCESNTLIKKYKRRNRILCDKIDNLKRKIRFNKSMENEDKFPFEGQECLSHACLFVHTSLKVFNSCLWYIDSGCSHHMTGDKTLFKSLKEKVGDCVTFRDGSHAQVLGKGIVKIPGLPILKDVLYIKGLKANLL